MSWKKNFKIVLKSGTISMERVSSRGPVHQFENFTKIMAERYFIILWQIWFSKLQLDCQVDCHEKCLIWNAAFYTAHALSMIHCHWLVDRWKKQNRWKRHRRVYMRCTINRFFEFYDERNQFKIRKNRDTISFLLARRLISPTGVWVVKLFKRANI